MDQIKCPGNRVKMNKSSPWYLTDLCLSLLQEKLRKHQTSEDGRDPRVAGEQSALESLTLLNAGRMH